MDKILNPFTQAFVESPWGQEIFKQGLEQGRQEVVRRIIQRMIRHRFRKVSEAVEANLQRLNREQLEMVADRLIDGNSLEELMAAFPPVTDN
ncbi:DUF4351 domain-containing protein [Laspinema sp. A4]|uniref:DUF4351 domain-containing protein n=1 Tax=Laspinema sp. D2d TaxID=2953686 RepID=UPI0021BB316D|nr:DUF4351 domain-containing protein [Laspinema sp. D2d]MCT7982159.1 DUF4351 domain-containing protein [Laspinema sp. D2d]